MSRQLSVKDSDYELTSDYIIPAEYYDTHRLVFSHYQIDKKIVKIRKNGKQKNKKFTNSGRGPKAVVKTLLVNICSTKTTDISALHKIHIKIRNS